MIRYCRMYGVHRFILKILSIAKLCIKHRYAATLEMIDNNIKQNL